MKPLIVIYSKDAEFYLVLSHILEVDGFASALAGNVEETLKLAAETQVQAVVLDCRRDNDVAAGCARLKQDPLTSALPVVALIASGAERQHIELLKSRIDECFVRPMTPAKLLDYLQSRLVVERPDGSGAEIGNLLSYRDIEMQLDTHRVRRNGREIVLGPIEYKLLRCMLQNPEMVLSRDDLIEFAWPGNVYVGGRTVDVHISRLRKALKEGSQTDIIRTVRLAGYALEDRTS
jgi:two-component system, OmpR family, phosphate regulon response regulator PhoB